MSALAAGRPKVQRLPDGTVCVHSRMVPKIGALHGWPGPHFMDCAAPLRLRRSHDLASRHAIPFRWWELYSRDILLKAAYEAMCDERQAAGGTLWYWHHVSSPHVLETTVYGWTLPLYQDLLTKPVTLSARAATRAQLDEAWVLAQRLTHRPRDPLTDPPVDVAWVMHPSTRGDVLSWEHEQQSDYLDGLRAGRDPHVLEELMHGVPGPGMVFDMPSFADPGEHTIRGLPVHFSTGTPAGQICMVRVLGQPGVDWLPLTRPSFTVGQIRRRKEARRVSRG